jgi:hypothetical protein
VVTVLPTELSGFIWYVFLGFISICGFLAIWVLTKIDRNQTELFNRMQQVEGKLSYLEGVRDAQSGGGHRK